MFDSRGDRVDRQDSAVDSSDPLLMSVSVEPLADGTYTVAWKNVSTVDGHRVRGAFVFSVGAGLNPHLRRRCCGSRRPAAAPVPGGAGHPMAGAAGRTDTRGRCDVPPPGFPARAPGTRQWTAPQNFRQGRGSQYQAPPSFRRKPESRGGVGVSRYERVRSACPSHPAPDRLPCPAGDHCDRGPAGGVRGSTDRPGIRGVRVVAPRCVWRPRMGAAVRYGVGTPVAVACRAGSRVRGGSDRRMAQGRQPGAGGTRRRAGRGSTADDQPDQSRGRDRQCAN